MNITVNYRAGHSYDEEWEPTELFCTNCGEKKVWAEQSEGDYYIGGGYMCSGCGFSFTQPTGNVANEPEDLQRLAALRAESKEPVD